MKFTQRLNREDIDIEGLPPYTDIIECEFLVEWELDLEFREWGVKSAHVSIIDIQGEYTTVTYDDEGNDGPEVRHKFNRADHKVCADVEWTDRGQLMVTSLRINLPNKIVSVY